MQVFRIDNDYYFNFKGIEGKIKLETLPKGRVIGQQVTDVEYNGNEAEELELIKHLNSNFDLILKAEKI